MKAVPLLAAAALAASLAGCAIVPAEPGYGYAYAPPPVVVVRPAYGYYGYRGYGPRYRHWR